MGSVAKGVISERWRLQTAMGHNARIRPRLEVAATIACVRTLMPDMDSELGI